MEGAVGQDLWRAHWLLELVDGSFFDYSLLDFLDFVDDFGDLGSLCNLLDRSGSDDWDLDFFDKCCGS